MASEGVRGPDWWGRGIGLAVFFLGIALLLTVFFWTSSLGSLAPKPGEKIDAHAGVRFGVEIFRLFVSGLVASWIAGRGAQLYGAANRALSGD
jgi:hypothetical protein